MYRFMFININITIYVNKAILKQSGGHVVVLFGKIKIYCI